MRICENCDHCRTVENEYWHKPRLRCFRDRTLTSGLVLRADGIGSSVAAETASFAEPHRVPGDKCGPGRRHWKEKS